MKVKNIQTLFFQNLGIKQTIFKNTFWLAFAEGIARLLGFVLIIYITKILGVTEFGKFAFALAFVTIFAAFSSFGLSDITTREFSRDKESEKEYPAVLSLKILLSIGALILMLIGSFFITPDAAVRKVIWILAVFVLINNFFFIIYAFLRARQRMEYEAGAKILQILIMVSVGFFILLKFPSVENISYGYLFANLSSLILVLLFFYFKIKPLKLSFNKFVLRKFFRLSWPLGIATILNGILLSIDSVIMGYFNQITEAGWYNVSRQTIGVVIIPATFIYMSFYPSLSKLFKESREIFQKVWNYYMKSMIVLALPIVVGGFFLASQIVEFIFGPNFAPAILAFQILIFIVGINFLFNPYILILIVSGQQKKYLWVNLAGAITNIVLNFILIPRYSLYGASVAAVITCAVLFLLSVEFSRRFTRISIFNLSLLKDLFISFFASAVMFFAINQMSFNKINVLINIVVASSIYFFVLFSVYKLLNKVYSFVKIH